MGFGFETTAAEVVEAHDLSGYEAIVTGGSSGIGEDTTRQLARKGARVVIATRNVKAAQVVCDKLIAELKNGAQIEVEELDLSSLKSCRAFAERYVAKKRPLNILLLNAGVMACPKAETADGFEMQMGTNHIGHFVVFKGLVEPLKEGAKALGKPSRVVVLSSLAHANSMFDVNDINMKNKDYNKWVQYGNSKMANILFAIEANRLYSPENIFVNAVHPGIIQTPLARHMTEEDMKMMSAGEIKFKTVPQGASTNIFAAVDKSLEGKGGLYLENTQVSQLAERAAIQKEKCGHMKEAMDINLAQELWKVTEMSASRPKSSRPSSTKASARK